MKINYPYEAIRELAMNLIMHRTYETNAPARFYEYSDRIEMDNPGGLYGKVQPENFPHVNDYRNPVIAEAMKVLGYVNRFNRGISMVQEQLEANKNGLAIFDFKDITTFKVTAMSADPKSKNGAEVGTGGAENEVENGINEAINEAIKITSRQAKILQLIREDNSLSREAISKQLEVSDSSVYRDIEKLKKIGVLERIGGNKGGYWKINQSK